MRSRIRFVMFTALAGLLVLTGCSLPIRNIPGTGGTPGAEQLGTIFPQSTGYPVGTAYPAATATMPAVITATSGATATVGPTNTSIPAVTLAPSSTVAPSATPQVIFTVGVTPVTTQNQNNGISLPGQRTVIQFPQGATSYVVTANLQAGVPQGYQLNVQQGQRMFITIDGNASMQIYDPNLKPISGVLTAINPVQISVSQNGSHYIAVTGSGPMAMSVYIPPVGGNQNVPAPVPGQLAPIQFASGGTSASFTVNMNPAVPLGYTIDARAGQQMTVTTGGNATITVLTPAGEMLPSANAPLHQWIYNLPVSGNYRMIVLGSGQVLVTVRIPALATVVPTQPGAGTPVPLPASSTRVSFASGNASTAINANLTAGQPQGYVLRLMAGQTLYVSTTGQVDISIYGPSGNLLTTGRAAYPQRWSAPAAQDGDYTFVVLGSGPSTITFYVPPK